MKTLTCQHFTWTACFVGLSLCLCVCVCIHLCAATHHFAMVPYYSRE